MASGAVASIVSSAALGLVAEIEGKGMLQPVNATSHWLNGPRAAALKGADARHTAVGYATHHAATVFWAVLFEWMTDGEPSPAALSLLPQAAATGAIAAVIDYTITPRRFTPGWEFVLSKQAMAAAYGAMAIGLAVGSQMARRRGW